jgi:hypothetical protein
MSYILVVQLWYIVTTSLIIYHLFNYRLAALWKCSYLRLFVHYVSLFLVAST